MSADIVRPWSGVACVQDVFSLRRPVLVVASVFHLAMFVVFLVVSQVSPGRKYRMAFELAGQNASLAWNSEDCESLWTGRREGASTLERRDPSRLFPGMTDYPAGHAEGYPDSFKLCFRSFYQYIAAGDFSAPKPYPTFADGHRDNLLCDALVASQQTGGWISTTPPTPARRGG